MYTATFRLLKVLKPKLQSHTDNLESWHKAFPTRQSRKLEQKSIVTKKKKTFNDMYLECI